MIGPMLSRMPGIEIIRGRDQLSPPGTPVGDSERRWFLAGLQDILGGTRFLWLPANGDTTTSTDQSKNGATITYDATIASRITPRGYGIAVTFDGTDDEADAPDANQHSFGNSQSDTPFTIAALVYADDETPTAATTIVSRWNKDTDGELREWRFFLSATNGYLTLELYDESANAYIGRQYQTALSATTWTLVAATYDGSGSNNGVRLYVNGANKTVVDSSSGTYVAMENLNTVLSIGHTLSAAASPVAEEFWAGRMAFIATADGALSEEQNNQLADLIDGYYDLSL